MNGTMNAARIESADDGVLVETDAFESFSARVTPEEHEAAARTYAETGCVPVSYHAKMTSGYFRIKGLPW